MEKKDTLVDNRSMPAASIIPVLAYENIGEAIEWLCKTFGFSERWRVGHHRAQLAFGNGCIVVKEQAIPDDVEAGLLFITHSIMMRVEDVNAHYENAKICGAKIMQAPTDFPYGERQYNVKDIGGHQWTFSQSIADLAPEDWGGTSAIGT